MMQNLVNNQKNQKLLEAWIEGGRVPHAILIDGPVGSGRSSFAAIIAQALLCAEAPPCGVCIHCQKMEKGIHPDYLIYQGEGTARSFHISTVRQVREEAWIAPNEAANKVVLLKNAQEMSVQAQNALLKIMEEPPQNVYFILTCDNRENMLSTIRSRVAMLQMDLPDIAEAEAVLAQRVLGQITEKYHAAAIETGGNIGRALKLLESEQSRSHYQQAELYWVALRDRRELDALQLLSSYERDKEGFLQMLDAFYEIVAGNVVSQSCGGLALGQCTQILEIVAELKHAVMGNGNMLLLVTLLSAKMAKALE